MATLRGFGSALVGRNVLRALSSFSDLESLAYVPDSWRSQASAVRNIVLRYASPGALSKLWLENTSLRRAIRQFGAEKVFSLTDTSLPACPRPQLLMVQQAYLAYRASDWGFEMTAAFRAKMKLMEQYFAVGLPSLTALTVQTEHMKRHLCERWRIYPDRVFVVPSSLDASDAPEAMPGWKPNPEGSAYICYVAAAAPHKNHMVLADMMAKLRPDSQLRCVLTATPEALPGLVARARVFGVLDRFEFRGNVSRQESYALLSHALASVIPSKLESFGLTYLEAMAIGTPLIVADVDAARELCGEAALYASPDAGEDFAAHVERLADSPGLASVRSRLALDRFAQVHSPWPEIASKYLRILEAL